MKEEFHITAEQGEALQIAMGDIDAFLEIMGSGDMTPTTLEMCVATLRSVANTFEEVAKAWKEQS